MGHAPKQGQSQLISPVSSLYAACCPASSSVSSNVPGSPPAIREASFDDRSMLFCDDSDDDDDDDGAGGGGRCLCCREAAIDSSVGAGASGAGAEIWYEGETATEISQLLLLRRYGRPTGWSICEEFASIIIVEASDSKTPSYCTTPPAAGLL